MSSEDATYNDYSTEGGQQVPVQDDNAPIEEGVDAATADSDAQLGTSFADGDRLKNVTNDSVVSERDDNEAIDKSNIVEGRTRGAKPDGGSYREPGDNEALPSE